MRSMRLIAATVAATLAASFLPTAIAGAAGHEVVDGSMTSFDGTQITYTLFRPTGATADAPVPMILHSHGWGGTRSTSGFDAWLDQGFGVLSFDQRGFGTSGRQAGQFNATANIQDPDFEARDVVGLIDLVAGLDWVAKDVDANGDPIADDPVLGGIGASYGGGYQWVTALYETETTGHTRFNALAPEISWFDLPDSLAPSGVVRTAWVLALYAAGSYALPEYVHQAFAYGAATGQWPDGTVPEPLVPNLDAELHEHGPVAFVERGVNVDVPTLVRQGASDNLFNLNQGLHNFAQTLTDGARKDSLFVGYNGGHALPNVLPAGAASGADPCSELSASGSWEQLTRDFYAAVFSGGDTRGLLPGHLNLATMDGSCLALAGFDTTSVPVTGNLPLTVTTTGAGVPQHVPIAEGPITVAGISQVEATVTSVGADQRVFLGLSVGTDPVSATVVQNNLLPLHELVPVVGEGRTIELPGVAVEVPAGETLYLTVTPVADMYFAHGSVRSPGIVTLEDVVVHLSVPGVADDGGDEEEPSEDCKGLTGPERAACQRDAKDKGQATTTPAWNRARVR